MEEISFGKIKPNFVVIDEGDNNFYAETIEKADEISIELVNKGFGPVYIFEYHKDMRSYGTSGTDISVKRVLC